MEKMGIGLQLYTLRDDLARDFAGTLRVVAEMGYEGVEFAGYGNLSADDMKKLLDELGLKAVGSHIALKRLDDDIAGEIAYLKTIGAAYGIVPHLAEADRADEATWEKTIARLSAHAAEFAKHGLKLGYHNHAFEFELKLDGEYVFDAIYSKTSPDQLVVEMDLGWVQYAGEDPLAYIAKYEGRLPLLHLKDFRKAAPGEPIDTVELGEGDLNLPALIEAAGAAKVEWIIVEQDRCANPPLQSVRTSREWLKSNYK
ncbi:sugar phosphate isomerase/epimerase [Paenibacillus sp. IB182496]|uniref:Sugar phosphate isomerase/epimerase n=1 Tax=Paenibacillus sabuli TaxID=2772509 RepID=A0A927BUU1_9BACL|nr:sugar phosphate isomerase/epimerase [Paenibacillus sabuli]MBD2847241.1 sugar phosphate isomerase/epimerase [Paenibacillus sabuli]